MNTSFPNAVKGSKIRGKNKTYYGNYLGIVIQNNDPEKRGRVKVYVPYISPAIYNGWNTVNENKLFKFLGKNIKTDINGIGDKSNYDILDQLKQVLPWAECAAPLIGEMSSGRYNANEQTGTISDSNRLAETKYSNNFIPTKYSLNKDGIGEKPARVFEVDELAVNDAFNKTTKDDVGNYDYSNTGTIGTGNPNRVNPYAYNYKPHSYSNSAKGSFSVPSVGAHIWVFYREGDPMVPVYFAAHYGATDWQSIYEIEKSSGLDYPDAYENISKAEDPSYNNNTETYRNKYVVNQKGGTIEVINTDNKELLKLTHYSGSFKEWNNKTSTEFAANNNQRLIMGDNFDTIKGFDNQFIEKDQDKIIRGDKYEKIGNFNKEAILQWKGHAEEIAVIKQLFETKRTDYYPDSTGLFFYQSPLQTKAGKGAPCPLCTGGKIPINIAQYTWTSQYAISTYNQVNANSSFACGRPQANWTSVFDGIDQSGFYIPNANGYNAKNIVCAPASDIDRLAKLVPPPGGPNNFLNSGPCPVCNGTGISPSSQDGEWESSNKSEALQEKLKIKIEDFTKLEKQLGDGGSLIRQITKHKWETIGLVMNDLPGIRKDPLGKISNSEMYIGRQGVVTSMAASPVIEYVNVEDLPGGTYNLNIANRWNVLVGAGGIVLKSYGPVDISGTVTNIAGEQVNISSQNEVNIISDKRIYMEAEILVLKSKYNKQVLVDSSLGVSQNLIVGGSAHVEGELTVQHITGPTEIQETEEVKLQGKVQEGCWYPCEIIIPQECRRGCASTSQPQAMIKFKAEAPPITYHAPHSHQFRNLPLTLTTSKEDVRAVAAQNTLPANKTASFPVINEKKFNVPFK